MIMMSLMASSTGRSRNNPLIPVSSLFIPPHLPQLQPSPHCNAGNACNVAPLTTLQAFFLSRCQANAIVVYFQKTNMEALP